MTLVTVLPIHCAYCHGAVTLHVSNWPGHDEDPAPEASHWSCPYCQKENRADIPGYLERVTEGHDDPDEVGQVN